MEYFLLMHLSRNKYINIMKRETENSISLGSTADIAFLLLIFFLVVTTISVDQGLIRKLPEKIENPTKPPTVKERNLLVVLINSNDQLMIEKQKREIHEIKDITTTFLTNPDNSKNLPAKEIKDIPGFGQYDVNKGIISLQNDRNTSYGKYIEVMNELIKAGNIVKNDFSMKHFEKPYSKLTKNEKQIVKKAVPVMISEAEPKEIGN
jgi:biopolymer transport protein ExbD